MMSKEKTYKRFSNIKEWCIKFKEGEEFKTHTQLGNSESVFVYIFHTSYTFEYLAFEDRLCVVIVVAFVFPLWKGKENISERDLHYNYRIKLQNLVAYLPLASYTSNWSLMVGESSNQYSQF